MVICTVSQGMNAGWLSAHLESKSHDTPSKGKLEGYLRPFRTQNDGFECQDDMKDGWSRKLGYVAIKAGASVTFEVKDIQQDVRYVMLDYLKSYGDKWSNSQARFTASVMKKDEEA